MDYELIPPKPGYWLTPEAEGMYEEWAARYGGGNCSCHLLPPCYCCTDPGNPRNLNEDPDAWAVPLRPLTYLAGPYTHPDPVVRETRLRLLNMAAGWLVKQGHVVFSPVSHFRPIEEHARLPDGWEFWESIDRAYIGCSSLLVVLKAPGWFDSAGVAAEAEIAEELGVPVRCMEVEEVLLTQPHPAHVFSFDGRRVVYG